METLSPREREVIAEITRFARRFGRWGTVREVSKAIADKNSYHKLFSVGSTFRALYGKGLLSKDGQHYAIKGYAVKVQKATLVKIRASRDAL